MGCLPNFKYPSKKKSFFAQEQERPDVKVKRENFIDSLQYIDPYDIIVLDEAGADLTMATEYSRAEGGKRVKAPKPFVSTKKFSMIGAISMLGIESIMYLELAVNTSVFLSFVKKCLSPKLKAGKYVVLDNVSFHKNQEIIQVIESTGAKVVFLPPYSPDLSPIEKMWSKIKEILKRLMPRTQAEFHDALAEATSNIQQDDCEEWFDACGYNV